MNKNLENTELDISELGKIKEISHSFYSREGCGPEKLTDSLKVTQSFLELGPRLLIDCFFHHTHCLSEQWCFGEDLSRNPC